MNKIRKKIIIAFFCLCSLPCSVLSQGIELGLGMGGSLYWGDLSPSKPAENFGNLRAGAELYLRYTYSESFSFRANILMTRLAGDDALSSTEWMANRNLSFHSNVLEVGVIGEYDLLKFDLFNRHHGLKFYIMGGVSIFRFNPKAEYQGATYELQPLGTEGQGLPGFLEPYSLTSFAFPLGGGMKIKLSENLILNPEFSARMTTTDFLDDVSYNHYVNYFELRTGNGEIAAALANRQGEALGLAEPVIIETGTQRRGGASKDFYFIGMIHLTYRFSESFQIHRKKGSSYFNCPEF